MVNLFRCHAKPLIWRNRTLVQAQPLSLAFWGLRFESSEWKKLFKMALAAPTIDPARPPELYCETNTSTQVTLVFDLRDANTPEPQLFPFGFETSRKLALLVLAFEGEIDKLLADHRGYITHSVSLFPDMILHGLRELID